MTRITLSLAAAMAVTAAALPADASWIEDMFQSCSTDFHRMNAWPEPFVYPDRASTVAPFNLMVANGWRRQNLIGEYYFDQETGELTRAGELKVLSILTQNPPQFRTVFVQRDVNADITSERIDAVQQVAVRFTPHGELPQIEATHLIADGRPGDEVDQINTRFQQTRPTPQLPTFESSIEQ